MSSWDVCNYPKGPDSWSGDGGAPLWTSLLFICFLTLFTHSHEHTCTHTNTRAHKSSISSKMVFRITTRRRAQMYPVRYSSRNWWDTFSKSHTKSGQWLSFLPIKPPPKESENSFIVGTDFSQAQPCGNFHFLRMLEEASKRCGHFSDSLMRTDGWQQLFLMFSGTGGNYDCHLYPAVGNHEGMYWGGKCAHLQTFSSNPTENKVLACDAMFLFLFPMLRETVASQTPFGVAFVLEIGLCV